MCLMHSHNHDEQDKHSGNGKSWLFSRTGLVTICALAILGFLIYEGHGAHLLGFAPYLLILACPLMHIFMHHGGHGDHHHHDQKDGGSEGANENKKHDGGCH
jgi:Protein of unknown function (DUF2933)